MPDASEMIELPNDRELALHEINSILTGLKSHDTEMRFASQGQWLRYRILGWATLAILVVALGWSLFYQYDSSQNLRRSLYETCVDNNTRSGAQRDLYDQIASRAESVELKALMESASSRLAPRDCKSIYLAP